MSRIYKLLVVISVPLAAQHFTAADYARAEKFMGYNTNPLVYHGAVRATWLDDGRFWYRTTTADGNEFVLVDPEKNSRGPAFDHARLAQALSAAAGSAYDAHHLPFTEIELNGNAISFSIGNRRWSCDAAAWSCAAGGTDAGGRGRGARNESISPDKKRAVFIRDNNLWSRDLATRKETQLTGDGIKDFGYATDNAGWSTSDRPIVLWSPDSKKVATFQQDQRGVGEMYLVNTKVGHPELRAWKYPLPGDDVVTTIQRVVIDVADPHVVRLKMPADQHRSSLCDDVACRGEWSDVAWSQDGSQLAFVSTSRDH